MKQRVLQRQSSSLPPPPAERSSPDTPTRKVKSLSSEDTVYPDSGDVSSVPPKFLPLPAVTLGRGWGERQRRRLRLALSSVPVPPLLTLSCAVLSGLQPQSLLCLAAVECRTEPLPPPLVWAAPRLGPLPAKR